MTETAKAIFDWLEAQGGASADMRNCCHDLDLSYEDFAVAYLELRREGYVEDLKLS